MSEFCDKCGGTNKEIDLQGTIATLRCESCGYESITRYHFIEGIDISMLPDAFEVFVINGSRKTYLFVKKAFCGIGNYCHSDLLAQNEKGLTRWSMGIYSERELEAIKSQIKDLDIQLEIIKHER